jgi:hypothetical protein
VLRPAVLWPAAILLIAAVGGGAYLGYEAKNLTGSKTAAGTGTKTTPAAIASTAQVTPTAAPTTAAAIASPTISASPTVAASPTATATATAAGGTGATSQPSGSSSNPTAVNYLFAMQPIQGNATNGPVQIGTTTYQNSIELSCASYYTQSIVYDVAGFKFLTATLGVPNDSPNAAGNSTTITFFKNGSTTQLGPPITAALGQPQKIHLNLQGSDQLEVNCTATSNSGMYVALGNAEIGPS